MPDVLVNSKTENPKTFEGSSQARKGMITAEDDNWREPHRETKRCSRPATGKAKCRDRKKEKEKLRRQ